MDGAGAILADGGGSRPPAAALNRLPVTPRVLPDPGRLPHRLPTPSSAVSSTWVVGMIFSSPLNLLHLAGTRRPVGEQQPVEIVLDDRPVPDSQHMLGGGLAGLVPRLLVGGQREDPLGRLPRRVDDPVGGEQRACVALLI